MMIVIFLMTDRDSLADDDRALRHDDDDHSLTDDDSSHDRMIFSFLSPRQPTDLMDDLDPRSDPPT